jgi:N-acetylmuramoyl-L-alanine amidase
MRLLCALVLVAWSAAGIRGHAATNGTSHSFLPAQYVELQSWAQTNHFHFSSWHNDKEDQILVTNRWAKLCFKGNSQKAEVNGITLFLAFPILLHQGSPYVAQKDLERTLKPILFPAKEPLHHSVMTVAICAGHGGKDVGYQIHGQQEKRFTLLLAKEVQRLVARAGLKPILIRDSDKLVDYDERPKLAQRGKADVYLEVHYNSAGAPNNEIRGVETYCLTPAGANSTNGGSEQYGGGLAGNRHDERNILLAYQIHRALVENAAMADRGVRRARFVVLRDALVPAVLVEAGFMSHPDELHQIQDSEHRREIAQAILDGLLAYKRLVERN